MYMAETQENWVTPEMAQTTTTFKTFLLLAKHRRKMVGGGGGSGGCGVGRCSMFMGDYQEKQSKQGYGCYADLSQWLIHW